MTRALLRTAVLLAMIVTAVPVRAAESSQPAEVLLAEESVLYFRFDGLGSHEDAYRRTIIGQLLRNELGPLVDDLTRRIVDAIGPQLLSERLLSGIKPDQLLKVQNATKQIPRLQDYFSENGFVVGVEVIAPLAPRFQVTIVFPNGGTDANRSAIFGGFRLLGLLTETEVQEVTHGKRTLLQLSTPEPGRVLCWQEGEHMVLTIGTEEIDHTLDLVAGKRGNLTSHATYKQLANFKGYETFERGFFDLDRVITIAEKSFPPAAPIIDRLGLRGLKNVRFQFGFQGRHLRSTVILDLPGKREGVLRLLGSAEGLDLAGLPHLPPDAVSVAASRFEVATAYDTVIDVIELGLGTFQPGSVEDFAKQLETVESALGIDLRKDLFATLGSTLVVYNSPSEGPFTIGMGVAIEVKDSEKLTKSLDTLMKSLPALIGADISVRKRDYRGTVMNTVHVEEGGFPFAPCYAIHDGWLIVSFFPQTVQGFIYRGDGKHAVWKPPSVANSALADVKRADPQARITAISVSDPKPTVVQILSLSPFLVKMFTSFSGAGSDFDVSLIPNAQSVTEQLTHNVSIAVDSGESIRFEGYSSFPTLFQISGLESYVYLLSFSLFSFAF